MDNTINENDITWERESGESYTGPATPRSQPFPSQTSAVGIESIRRARREGLNLKQFPLKRTGGIALVRRPSLLSLAVNGQIPQNLKGIVNAMVLEGSRKDKEQASEEFLSGDDPLGRMADLVRATAIAGFANPKLVADNTSGPIPNDTMYVSEIDIDDLTEYFYWCQRDEEEKAAAVASFPERESEPVSARPRLQAVRADAI